MYLRHKLLETHRKGDRYTWERQGLKERLDWSFHNVKWESQSPNTFVSHELRSKSDHRLQVVNSNQTMWLNPLRAKSFAYQAT